MAQLKYAYSRLALVALTGLHGREAVAQLKSDLDKVTVLVEGNPGLHGREAVAQLKFAVPLAEQARAGRLHGREAVAQLKLIFEDQIQSPASPSPRPRSRGSIEVGRSARPAASRTRSPRPRSRGSIEVGVVNAGCRRRYWSPRPRSRGSIEVRSSLPPTESAWSRSPRPRSRGSIEVVKLSWKDGNGGTKVSTAEKPWLN